MTEYYKCPICGYDEFYKGPKGGVSQNVQCGRCESILNITPFGIDIIEKKEQN